MSRYCFVMIVSPEVEEKLLDELLIGFSADVFTSTPTFTHGAAPGELQADEQVLGRRRAVQVQILTERSEAMRLRQMLLTTFPNAGVHYWILPVIDEGDVL